MNKFEELLKFTFNAAFSGASSRGPRFLGQWRPPVVKLYIAQFRIGLFFQLKQVSHQFELGQDWVLSQRVVNNILQHRIVPFVTVGV